ncbi:CHAT domain-containing protein [Streptomyces sp. NPDC020799]|uniref:CHAT domain-containing protein n=1 Tax=Streptomyces sp. NPDC020799 TaxID=3365091 RepID=UPI00379FA301
MTFEASLDALVGQLRALRTAGRHEELFDQTDLALTFAGAFSVDAAQSSVMDMMVVIVADNAASAARQPGDRERLRRYADETVAAGSRIGGSLYALGLGWRALAYELDGRFAAAAADYIEALAVLRDEEDPIPRVQQKIRANYAELLEARGEHDSARGVMNMNSSASIATGSAPSSSGQAAGSAIEIAVSKATMSSALDELTRLKADALSKGNKRTAGVSASNIGTALFNAGQSAAAIPHLIEARDLLREAEEGEHLAVACLNLGLAHRMLQHPEAIDCLTEAWAVIRVVAPRSPKALGVLYALARQRFETSDFERAKAALDRGIGLYEAIRPEIAVEESEHEGTLETYRLMLELRIMLAMKDGWTDQAVDLIERGKARLWSELLAARATHHGTSLNDQRPVKAASVTGPKAVMLNYFVGPNITFVAYNRPGRPDVLQLDISAKDLQVLTDRVTSQMQLWQSRSGADDTWRLVLGALLLGELNLTGAQAVFVFPDGPLWDVPFAAMPTPDLADYLGEAAPTIVAPTLRVLAQIQRRKEPLRATSQWQMVALGDPAAGPAYGPIPGTGRQVEWLRSVVPSVIPLLGPKATKHELLQHLVASSHIHLATHAEARQLGSEPHLVLSNGDDGPDRLSAPEIARMTLRADLVFLSACGTFAGRPSTGEGLASVARAFILAGARCVVAAAWPIPDEDAELLVRDFYAALLSGISVARAVRTAQRAARKAGAGVRVWAALQVLGDGLADDDQLQLLLKES